MKIFLIAITLVSAVLLIGVILLQQGKGADLGSAFGRGAQGGLFTSTGKANFLTRLTSGLVTVFLVSALALSIFLGDSAQDTVLEELQRAPAGAPAEVSDDALLPSDGDEEADAANDAATETTPD